MRLSYASIITALSIFLLSSCASNKGFYQNIPPNQVEAAIIELEDISIELAYVGAIGHSFIFECAVTNHTDGLITINKSDFAYYSGNHEGRVLSEDAQVELLKKEREKLKRQRKNSTIFGVVLGGLSIAAGASQGADVAQTIFSGAETTAYIIEDNQFYSRNIESVEDEIEYLRSAQFNNTRIAGSSQLVRDVLIPAFKVKDDVTIVFEYRGDSYYFDFPKRNFR